VAKLTNSSTVAKLTEGSTVASHPDRRARRSWRDLSPAHKAALTLAAAVQFGLAGAAWLDLARRPASQVPGPKWRWALLIAVNFAGPIAYFRWGPPHKGRAAGQ